MDPMGLTKVHETCRCFCSCLLWLMGRSSGIWSNRRFFRTANGSAIGEKRESCYCSAVPVLTRRIWMFRYTLVYISYHLYFYMYDIQLHTYNVAYFTEWYAWLVGTMWTTKMLSRSQSNLCYLLAEIDTARLKMLRNHVPLQVWVQDTPLTDKKKHIWKPKYSIPF